jgi:hypothetical protein
MRPRLLSPDVAPMSVNYDHARNVHTVGGATAALPIVLENLQPASFLDVGCGSGTWLHAAAKLGIPELSGVDGIVLPQDRLHVSSDLVQRLDLSQPFSLGRFFDVAVCLEVAEHLPESSADALIASLVGHADVVFFGAACPGQPGQHHVHCQWPEYWQRLFNDNGFVCDDAIRWRIWDNQRIEPWYRQNIFRASRDADNCGREARIKSVIHPSMLKLMYDGLDSRALVEAEGGGMSISWYLKKIPKALTAKAGKKMRRGRERSAS